MPPRYAGVGRLDGPEDLEPHRHPLVEGVIGHPLVRRGVEALDAEPAQLPLGQARAPRGRPARRRVDRHRVGSEVGDQRGDTVDRDAPRRVHHGPVAVEEHEVEPLADADVDAEDRTAYGRDRCARNSRKSLRVRTPRAWPALTTRTAGRLQRLERDLHGLVELDQRDRRPHDLGDVGLQGIGIAEDAVEQRALADRADELRDVLGAFPDDRRLRDRVVAAARRSPDAPCRAPSR